MNYVAFALAFLVINVLSAPSLDAQFHPNHTLGFRGEIVAAYDGKNSVKMVMALDFAHFTWEPVKSKYPNCFNETGAPIRYFLFNDRFELFFFLFLISSLFFILFLQLL